MSNTLGTPAALPALHVIAPFHTITSNEFSHCAFTGKALRFSKMMQPFGYRVVEYSNEGSTSVADEHVLMLNATEYKQHYQPEVKSPGNQAQVGAAGWNLFNVRLVEALRHRAKRGDIVCHIFGRAHAGIVQQFPGLVHVETGIGYPDDPMGAYRIFESYAWQHYQWGRQGNAGGVLPGTRDTHPAATWVIPNYFDAAEWPVSKEQENAVAFMGRFVVDKGIDLLRRLIKAWHRVHPSDGMKFLLAGMGDFAGWFAGSDFSVAERERIVYLGALKGAERAELIGRVKAFLLPSIFVEPFGGAAVEAMLCGTPAITPDFGAFTETVQQGVTGYRCRTTADYVKAIENINLGDLDRAGIAWTARDRFSLEACGEKYDEVFRFLAGNPVIE